MTRTKLGWENPAWTLGTTALSIDSSLGVRYELRNGFHGVSREYSKAGSSGNHRQNGRRALR